MKELFLVTGALAALGGITHGYLGERMILIPLRRPPDLPRRHHAMLRFTWHFFSVVMLTLAVVFFALGSGVVGGGDWTVVRVIAGYFAVFGVLVLVLSRGRHFAWLGGLAVAVTAWLGTL